MTPVTVPNPFVGDTPPEQFKAASTKAQAVQEASFTIEDKLAKIRAEKQQKLAELNAFAHEMAGQTDLYNQRVAAEENSVVGRLGLDPDGVLGSLVNFGAGMVAGGSRQIVGASAALPYSFDAFAKDTGLSKEDTTAYNNYVTGKASAADMQRLNQVRDVATPMGADEGSLAATPQMSLLDQIKQGTQSREAARSINNTFNIDSIEHQAQKNALDESLGEGFRANIEKIKAGDHAAGITGLLTNIADSAFEHPRGVLQYVAENAPQLMVGAFGAAGKAAMTASNIGYAADYYQQGIENFQKDNAGKLPAPNEREKIAAWAASLALAEEAGDRIGLAAMKVKGVAKAAVGAAEATESAAKTGMLQSMKRTLLAGLEGTAGETLTEGYQGYAEDVTAGKRTWNDLSDDALENIYKNAAIGGLTGGIMSGGVHGLAEATQSTPEQTEQKVQTQAKDALYTAAVESGNVDALLDKEAKHYDPVRALGALAQNNIGETATPESRMQNFDKAAEIVRGFDAQRTELKDKIENGTPQEQKAAKAELADVLKQSEVGNTVIQKMMDEMTKVSGVTDIKAEVKSADTPFNGADDEVKAQATKSIDNVINLSMASTRHLTAEEATNLADNADNGFDKGQRKFLRVFSAARQAFNAAQDMGKITNTILNGDKKTGDLGIADYRNRIGTSLSQSDKVSAVKQLGMLTKFATSHAEKAAVAAEALEKYGENAQVYKTDDGWGYAKPGTYNPEELSQGGGLRMVKPRLVEALQKEAKALALTRDEMTQAVAMKFGRASTQQATAPVQSITPTPASTAKQSIPPAPASISEQETASPGNESIGLAVEGGVRLEDKSLQTPPLSGIPVVQEQQKVDEKTSNDSVISSAPTPSLQPSAPIAVANAPAQGTAASSASVAEAHLAELAEPKPDHTTQRARDILTWAEQERTKIKEQLANYGEVDEHHAALEDAHVLVKTLIKAAKKSIEADEHFEQSVEIQPEAAQQQAAVSEANPAPVAEAAPATEEKKAAIAALTETTTRDTPYTQRKLGDFFNVAGLGSNPLASVKDFMSSIKNIDALTEFLGTEPDADEKRGLRTFIRVFKGWAVNVTQNLKQHNKVEYNYEDAMQYFIRPDGDIEENVKAAIIYAAYSYVVENFSKHRNTDAEINRMLGRDKNDHIGPMEEKLRNITAFQSSAVNALGQRIVQALGLQAKETTPVNELPRMQAALGAHALRLLIDGEQSLMVRLEITAAQLEAMKAKNTESDETIEPGMPEGMQTGDKIMLLQVRRNEDGTLSERAAMIVEGNRDSKSVVNRLFSVEDPAKPPTFKPVNKTKAFTKRTQQLVPEFLRDILLGLNKQKNFLRQDKLELLNVLGDDRFLSMMGKESVDGRTAANVDKITARNEGFERELFNLKDFIGNYLTPTENGLDTPFYFEHYAMRQQRVGIANNMVNPQLSKIHRFFVYRNSWKSQVNMNDVAQMDNFWLRVAEGFGMKTETMEKYEAINKMMETYQSAIIQEGVAAIQKIMAGESITEAEKDAVVTAVAKAKEGAHSLDALVGLASYASAEQTGAASFEANMMGEVDGVTNGPMLSMLLMGAAGSVSDLFNTLNLGGFFKTGTHTEFNSFRKYNQDLYLKTAGSVLNTLDSMVAGQDEDNRIDPVQLASVNFFLGNLRNDAGITKDGRNLVKTPITGVVYGSSIKTAIKNMSGDFFDKINEKIEDLYARQAKGEDVTANVKTLMQHLNVLGIEVAKDAGLSDLMTKEFSKRELNNLTNVFTETYGKAVNVSFKQEFAHLLENRKQFNEVANIAFDVYDAAYVSVRSQLVEELVANGEIPATTFGSPLHDLTPAQETIFQERMAEITPTLATAMSNLSGPSAANTGMLVAKSASEIDTTKPYKSQVKFGTTFKDVLNTKGEHPSSMMTYGRRTVNKKPGVALGATSTHSFDAAVAMSALWNKVTRKAHEILNLHDAGGTGLNDLVEQGRRMNEAVWDRAMEYSPAQEMYNTYMRTLRGVQSLMTSESLPAGFKRELAQRLVLQSADTDRRQADGSTKKIPAQNILLVRALQSKQLAHQIDSMKFEALSQMGTIAQYAIEGGALQVTDKMRDAALARLQDLQAAMPADDVRVVREVQDALKNVVVTAEAEYEAKQATKEGAAAPKANPKLFGTVGKSTSNDPKLLAFFARNPNPTVGQLVTALGQQKLTPFQSKLLASLKRSLGDRQAGFTVKYVTKATLANEVLERQKQPSHAWFVSKNGQNEIYVLSADFKESAVQAETLLHELTHAAVAHAINNPDNSTRPLVAELEELRQQLLAVAPNDMAHMLADVQEMVAYGMTNGQFQALLDAHLIQTKTGDNQWITGLKKFVDTLVKLIFPSRQNANLSTGLTTLISNVTGLMHASSINDYATNHVINQSMAVNALDSLSSVQMYDELGKLGTRPVDPAFDAHLRDVMNMMEQSVHTPLSALKAVAQQNAVQTPHQLWVMAKRKGAAAFGRGALASGFKFTEQEAFAMQQVQATIAATLDSKDGSTTGLYRELARLYKEAHKALSSRISEFHPDPKQAQALFDFVFKLEAGNGDRSDYLSRFAALGMTNQQFNKLLGFTTDVRSESMAGMPFSEKLHEMFERILNWVSARATRTFDGQQGDTKLSSLVEQLVNIEQRKRMKLAQSVGTMVDTFENVFRGAANTGINSVAAIANSPFFRNSTNGVTRLAGRMTAMTVQGRMDHFLDTLQTFRDKFIGERNGLLMGTIGEIRGAFDGNVAMHKLNRISKRIEGQRKDLITNTAQFVKNSFKDGGKYLTEDMHKAISAVLLRADVASLMEHFDQQAIERILKSPSELNRQIATFEGQLNQFGKLASYYRNGAANLGVFMATGKPGAENLRLNADNIANMLGFQQANKVNADIVEKATPIIDALATLYAVQAISNHAATHENMAELLKVIDQESNRTDGNGVELILKMHKNLQDESKARLFQGSGVHRMKGYTPEIYNPYIRIEVANEKDGKLLQERGFDQGAVVPQATSDVSKKELKHIYTLRDGGMVQYLTGIFSYTGMGRRGTSTHNGDLSVQTESGRYNQNKMRRIERQQAANKALQGSQPIDMLYESEKNNYMVPVFDENGDLVNHRYMMNVETKDTLLERNNDFSDILGTMAGNIFDKETTASQNRAAVQALHDQYMQDFNAHPESYMSVGPNSIDAEAREVWRLLPKDTKEAVLSIWGANGMLVRYDQMDINFGYRKLSLAQPFNMNENDRDVWQKIYVDFFEFALGKKAGLRVRQFEDVWQALVREAKDTMVVKSGITLLGNFTSNLSELVWFGVPLVDIWKHHRTALKGITSYRKDSKRLDVLERAVKLNHLEGMNKGEAEREIVRLKDALARNPVRELVDAGLMPTIVEDVAEDEDKYSYKSMLTEKVNDVIAQVNPHVLKVTKTLVMAHDTDLYKALSYGTQVSDFVARYTLYQHVINRAKDPMEAEKAVQLVADAFVSYDVPSHRTMQYANDMGLVYFSKYYLRIQKVIALLYKQNPGRALMLLTAGHFLDFIPMLQHSTALHRIGNPFSLGAFEAVTSLDEMMTVNALMSPFR